MPPQVLPVDSGLIRCICNFEHDDGFTIQCETCNAWQHAQCVGILNAAGAPDVYLCDGCHPRPLDATAAVERQQRWLHTRKKRGPGRRRGTDAERAASEDAEDSTNVAIGKKRGRKRRKDPETDHEPEQAVVDTPHAYYVKSDGLSMSDAAQTAVDALLNDLTNLSISRLSAPEFARVQPPHVAVRRVGSGLGLPAYGIVAQAPVAPDRFVMELTGELCTLDEYKANPINGYRRLGCPKPGVVVVPELGLVVDGRRQGCEAVFFRKAAAPNLRITPLVVENKLHIMAITLAPVKQGQELTVSWEWDADHPVRKLRHVDLADLDPAEQAAVAATAAALRDIGVAVASLSECVPDDDPPAEDAARETTPAPRPLPRARPSRNQLLLNQFRALVKPAKKEPLAGPVLKANVWVNAAVQGGVKKKLSLADYIKKRG